MSYTFTKKFCYLDKMEIFILLFLINLIGPIFGEPSVKDYCSTETFKAKCEGNDVILMQHAVYGRMRFGRCVKANLGYLGCSADVINIADSYCSGKSECDIVVPNGNMNKQVECYSELSRYLEASYVCVRALKSMDKCLNQVTIPVSSQVSHIPSSISKDSTCGRSSAPWILQAAPGQTINLTLYDFYWTEDSPTLYTADSDDSCQREYGEIINSDNNDVVKICGRNIRESHLYTSNSHKLQIVIDEKHLTEARFLIQYHAVGCPDLVKPHHAWTERQGDELVVGCEATRQTWHLKCVSNRWIGVIGNCTQYLPSKPESRGVKGRGYLSYSVMVILVIIGIASGISFIIITIGIYCYKRLSRNNKKMEAQYQCSTYKAKTKDLYNVADDMEEYKHYGYPEQIYPFSRNEYTHIWDQQGTPCSILDGDDIQQQSMPVHDAPLLPKARTSTTAPTTVRNNNNNISDLCLDMPPAPSVIGGGGGGGQSGNETVQPPQQRDDVLYRASISDSTGSGSTGLSKYYMLDKSA